MALADQTFGFFIPTVTLMGVGSSKETGAQVKALGARKALLVTDKGISAMGMADQIKQQVEAAGVAVVIFDGAEPNPTDTNVHDGVKVYRENGCDAIISLGGGNSHDCAKGVGLVIGNGGHIRDFEGVNKSTRPMPPFVAINTTAGTASEMTRFCIITNADTHVKMAIVDWRCTPNIAINDPVLMVGKPAPLTAATGMDALTHAVEAYVSTIATPITDACALQAIRLIADYLRPAVANGKNLEARDKMAYAEYLAGMAFNNASLGYVHAMAHQLGGFYNLPHGVCNAILLPSVCEFNMISNPKRFADIAVAMGENIDGLSDVDAAAKGIIRLLEEEIGKGTALGRILGGGAGSVGRAYGVTRVPVVKNQGIPAYDPRSVKGIGITYATSTMGADHTAGYTIATNILNVGGFVDPLKKEGQAELSRNLQIATAAVDSTGMCIFVAFPALDIPECLPALIDMINARSGINLTGDDVTNLGKHTLKVERQFNIEAGFTREHDRLPEFFRTEPVAPHNAVWDFNDEEIDEFWNFQESTARAQQCPRPFCPSVHRTTKSPFGKGGFRGICL
ncbi:MAG: iron-containing alcohol dehydrogenase [Desulfuromonadales bacterium]|nr:MAG: iron-containing alcohol dehydrogenase [Desulfuromonadales bacterium]